MSSSDEVTLEAIKKELETLKIISEVGYLIENQLEMYRQHLTGELSEEGSNFFKSEKGIKTMNDMIVASHENYRNLLTFLNNVSALLGENFLPELPDQVDKMQSFADNVGQQIQQKIDEGRGTDHESDGGFESYFKD